MVVLNWDLLDLENIDLGGKSLVGHFSDSDFCLCLFYLNLSLLEEHMHFVVANDLFGCDFVIVRVDFTQDLEDVVDGFLIFRNLASHFLVLVILSPVQQEGVIGE